MTTYSNLQNNSSLPDIAVSSVEEPKVLEPEKVGKTILNAHTTPFILGAAAGTKVFKLNALAKQFIPAAAAASVVENTSTNDSSVVEKTSAKGDAENSSLSGEMKKTSTNDICIVEKTSPKDVTLGHLQKAVPSRAAAAPIVGNTNAEDCVTPPQIAIGIPVPQEIYYFPHQQQQHPCYVYRPHPHGWPMVPPPHPHGWPMMPPPPHSWPMVPPPPHSWPMMTPPPHSWPMMPPPPHSWPMVPPPHPHGWPMMPSPPPPPPAYHHAQGWNVVPPPPPPRTTTGLVAAAPKTQQAYTPPPQPQEEEHEHEEVKEGEGKEPAAVMVAVAPPARRRRHRAPRQRKQNKATEKEEMMKKEVVDLSQPAATVVGAKPAQKPATIAAVVLGAKPLPHKPVSSSQKCREVVKKTYAQVVCPGYDGKVAEEKIAAIPQKAAVAAAVVVDDVKPKIEEGGWQIAARRRNWNSKN